MTEWADAWNAAAKLAYRMAASGISASKVRDVPEGVVTVMREMFANLRKANGPAFNEVVCEFAQHAAFGIADVIGLQAEIEAERAELSSPPVLPEDEPTQPGFIPPPELLKGKP